MVEQCLWNTGCYDDGFKAAFVHQGSRDDNPHIGKFSVEGSFAQASWYAGFDAGVAELKEFKQTHEEQSEKPDDDR